MAIRAVDTSNNKPKTSRSYLGAAAIGVLGGLAARDLIPVSSQEFDSFVSQNALKNRKTLTRSDIAALAKKARSKFDFAIISAATLVAIAFFKNMYDRLADKSN